MHHNHCRGHQKEDQKCPHWCHGACKVMVHSRYDTDGLRGQARKMKREVGAQVV